MPEETKSKESEGPDSTPQANAAQRCGVDGARLRVKAIGAEMGQFDKLETKVKLTVRNPASESASMFGSGIAELCIGVRELGSLNAAAKRMGMAYSKAWRIIRETEANLGFPLLSREGAHGSTLTAEGCKLLDAYVEIDSYLNAKASDMLKELGR